MSELNKYHKKVVSKLVNKKTKNLKNMRFTHKDSLVNMNITHLISVVNHEVFALMIKENKVSPQESYAVLAHIITPFDTDEKTIAMNVSRDVVFSNKIGFENLKSFNEELDMRTEELEDTNVEGFRKLYLKLLLDNSNDLTLEDERFDVFSYSEKLKETEEFKLFNKIKFGYEKDFLKDVDLSSAVWRGYHKLGDEEKEHYYNVRESSDLKELTDKEKDIEDELEKLKERIAFLEKENLKVKQQIRDKVILNMGNVSQSRNKVRRTILQEYHDTREIKNRVYVLNRDGNLDINSERWKNAISMYKKTSENVLKLNQEFKNN